MEEQKLNSLDKGPLKATCAADIFDIDLLLNINSIGNLLIDGASGFFHHGLIPCSVSLNESNFGWRSCERERRERGVESTFAFF